ncbi:MAG: dicarboxylate/amino acid:cation symporter [Peptococcaceae bacterium]|nr:dicarboxylate/amino acid:cation symporter [Peptococcaceae bacterium]
MALLRKINITTWIIIGTIAGLLAGWAVGPAIGQIKFIGDIFLRLIQMSVVVLIMGSVIEAVGTLSPKDLGRVGIKVLALFAVFTIFSAGIGIVVSNIFEPGVGLTGIKMGTAVKPPDTKWATIITNFFPTNIIDGMAKGEMIQAIVFSLLFGLATSYVGEPAKKVLDFIGCINKILTRLITMVIYLAPIGIFALMAWVTGTIGIAVIIPLAKFLLTFLVGTVIVFTVVVGIAISVAKVNPITFFRKASRMIIVAVTTTSSAVTFPVQIKDSEERMGMGSKTTRLVYPLGMTMNSDGLALFLSIAMLTIAQFFGIHLDLASQIKVVLLATLMCVGTVVVPGGGLVALAMALPAVGLPLEGVALLAGIDWFSGILRTLLNTINDTAMALWISASEGDLDREIFNSKEDLPEIS